MKNINRKYYKAFHYAGMSRLSHCEGEEWEEVWTDPMWETKSLTANRAKYLYNKMKTMGIESYFAEAPKFVAGRRYVLSIIDTGIAFYILVSRGGQNE